MAVYLPPCLAAVAKLAAKDLSRGGSRFSVNGVHVIDKRNGTFRVEATDGRKAVVVRGDNYRPEGLDVRLPNVGELADEAVISTADWIEAFRLVPRLSDRGPRNKLEWPVAIRVGTLQVALATGGACRLATPLDGRYPDIGGVLPKKAPLCSVTFNPHYLCEIVNCASSLFRGDDADKITMHVYDRQNGPVGFTARTGSGLFFDALLMPLS